MTNLRLPKDLNERKDNTGLMSNSLSEVDAWCHFHDYDFRQYKGEQRIDKIARNLVDYEAGKTILECALNIAPKKAIASLFDDNHLEI